MIDTALLMKWNTPVPRYTSYPTAPQFQAIDECIARERLAAFGRTEKPLSIYIHIPFCRSMCLFCGCSVILNRNPEKQTAYLDLLFREIELAAIAFQSRRNVSQLHLGGGTPTSLTIEEFELLIGHLHTYFDLTQDAEISIEIDPRTVFEDDGKKLAALKRLGFNRVSFGVQDLDPDVQEAVRRRQSEEMTIKTVEWARELRFEGINVDLIYGLPLQTVEKFKKTANALVALRPDRIAFFSYAKVPWLKQHQKAIKEEDLPSDEEKFGIYTTARQIFIEGGYVPIGMDHFSLEKDSLTRAYRERKLYRNFQGYSIEKAEDLIGFGVTSIGFIEGTFLQNVKSLDEYKARIERNLLPVFRGFTLQPEDVLRRWVIQQIMCRFEIDKIEFESRFRTPFDLYFAKELPSIEALQKEGLIENRNDKIVATEIGRLFVRVIAALFDAYLTKGGQFSRAV